MRNFWLDRVERRRQAEIKQGKLKQIGEAVARAIRIKKVKKDGD